MSITESDLELIAAQLGRIPRGVLEVAARCQNTNQAGSPSPTSPATTGKTQVPGHPAVIKTAPRLPDGSPFPTFYYLTCPQAVAACSQLEAEGFMRQAEALLDDPKIRAHYANAHRAYLAARAQAGGNDVPEIAGISAGGMPRRVKCFHALLAHSLAEGKGVNPIGDWVQERLETLGLWSAQHCAWIWKGNDNATGSY